MRSSPFPVRKVRRVRSTIHWGCRRCGREGVLLLAFRASDEPRIVLQYAFLTRVVHAGLAHIVRWFGSAAVFPHREHESVFVQFLQFISLPFGRAAFQFNKFMVKLMCSVFSIAMRVGYRRLFLEQLKGRNLRLDDCVIQFLGRCGDLQIITGLDGRGYAESREVQCCECRSDIHPLPLHMLVATPTGTDLELNHA